MSLTEKLILEFVEKNRYENIYYAKGYQYIAGIDEVGRGPLAGPVVVAAVILDPNNPIYGLKDSKKIPKKKINVLAQEIMEKSLSFVIVEKDVECIEKIGIRNSVLIAMTEAVQNIKLRPDFVLVDYEQLENTDIPFLSLTKGDNLSNSIAAASIVAKNYRDQKMGNIGLKYPEYKFENNAGYGTRAHLTAIENYGIIEGVHRKTFKPIRRAIEKKN